ncbi:hypothetical protein [Candidatus Avelusimicrobium gallicola]|uniref:Uncharacterized protein n=1 Tax=Candidatus Avelusimicrobium gallicola TaxID=2562704 RepID=A0A1Y4DEI9_9BACT|nr:hypothetical protein [Elusimicrobium sp. An273]OUO57497.1 hypothetical protein B5F75_01620 [Elusimicrobium sp. An273]
MKQAYVNMRNFWLDVKNLENRKGVIEIGPDKISVAGIEMAMQDGNEVKHLFLATNSLGDSSLYFENNSKSGLGGIIGGHGHEALQETAARMLAHASKLTGEMTAVAAGGELPPPSSPQMVRLFAVSKEKLFYTELPEVNLRNPENNFYPFFAYSQQTLGLFREQETQASSKPGHS